MKTNSIELNNLLNEIQNNLSEAKATGTKTIEYKGYQVKIYPDYNNGDYSLFWVAKVFFADRKIYQFAFNWNEEAEKQGIEAFKWFDQIRTKLFEIGWNEEKKQEQIFKTQYGN